MIRLDSGPRCSGGEIYWLIRRVIAGHQPNPTTGARAPTRAPALSLAAAPTDHELSLDDILQQLRNEIDGAGYDVDRLEASAVDPSPRRYHRRGDDRQVESRPKPAPSPLMRPVGG